MDTPEGLGRYRVTGKLGVGGSGEVYRAHDTKLGRDVAIKLLSDGPSERLLREAQAASALEHPNIVTVHGFEEHEGHHFVVMELVEGTTLSGRRLERAEALELAVQIASALAVAHGAGIVHRDLKPSNVMVTGEGRIKILDFGLAELAAVRADDEPDQEVTRSRDVSGTAGYMSPEQAEGKPLDARSDLFSVGCVLYEMLTGQPAFPDGTEAKKLTAVLRDEPRRTRHISGELERIVRRALQKDPERRFQSAADMRVALHEVSEENLETTPSWSRRGSILAAAMGLSWAAYFLWPSGSDEAAMRFVALTTDGLYKSEPALSPDGRYVAYVAVDEWDRGDIVVQQIDGEDRLHLTSGPAQDVRPTWSPDGQRLVFHRWEEGDSYGNFGVYEMSVLGGEPRRVATTRPMRGGLAWSPDGRYLVITDVPVADGPSALFLLDLESGQREPLTQPNAGGGDRMASFSPDGRLLAFVRRGLHDEADVYVSSIAQKNERRLTFDDVLVNGVDWTRDSRNVIFASDREGTYALWTVPVDGGEPVLMPHGPSRALSPTTARGADRLVYVEQSRERDIWRAPGPTSKRRDRPHALIASNQREAHPAYSPDGRSIAFFSNRSGPEEIWVSNADGTNPRQLVETGQSFSPFWSPDGRFVSFDSRTGGAGARHLVVDAEGGFPRELCPAPAVGGEWSHDGEWVFCGRNRSDRWELYKVPAEGGEPVLVSRRGGPGARVTPDGRYVYFNAGFARSPIWRQDLDTGEEALVLESDVRFYRWTLWGYDIVYLDDGGISIYDVENRKSRPLVELPGVEPGDNLSVSPDGEWVLFVVADETTDLILVENFR